MSKFAGFNKVKLTKPQRSSFDMTHERRMSIKPGMCVPCLVVEAVPSDQFHGSSELLLRLAPLLAPIYDQLIVYVHFFFVPNRLLWENWEEFITGGRLGVGVDPVNAPVPPYFDIGTMIANYPTYLQKGSLADYLGVPELPMIGNDGPDYDGIVCDGMPFVAYQLIWQEYYMSRNFNNSDFVEPQQDADGTFGSQFMVLRPRSYMHDYFTSALPFTQRGEDVLIPLDGSVTYLQQSILKRSDTGDTLDNADLLVGSMDAGDGTVYPPGSLAVYNGYGTGTGPGDAPLAARVENIDSISNLSTTINDFRSAYALQVWLERNAVGGSRYTESTQAHFGVRPQDSRLQRPEYIGGGRINVKISEVVSTAYSTNAEDAVVPLANMAGHGVSFGGTNSFSYFCTEHGFIMGIVSIMNPPSYHQGLPKMFRRRSFLDYPWPTFAKLGEQEVSSSEIFASAENLTEDSETGELPLFGYQSRYAEWKYLPNTNHGDFHDDLLFWTCTRDFATSPTLGDSFLELDQSAVSRIFAVESGDQFWIYLHNKVFVKRPLPYFGTPNTLGFV